MEQTQKQEPKLLDRIRDYLDRIERADPGEFKRICEQYFPLHPVEIPNNQRYLGCAD